MSTRIEYSPRTEFEKCGNVHTVSTTNSWYTSSPSSLSCAVAVIYAECACVRVSQRMIQWAKEKQQKYDNTNKTREKRSEEQSREEDKKRCKRHSGAPNKKQHRNRIYRNIAFAFQNWNITSTKWFSLCLPLNVLSVFFFLHSYDCLLFSVCLLTNTCAWGARCDWLIHARSPIHISAHSTHAYAYNTRSFTSSASVWE